VPTPASFQAPATRLWAADFLVAAIGYSQWEWSYKDRVSFHDLSTIPANARMMLQTAFAQRIVQGNGTTFFHPGDPVTRAQAAVMVLAAEKRVDGAPAPSLPPVAPYPEGPLADMVFVNGPGIYSGLQGDLTTHAWGITDVGLTDYYFLQGVQPDQYFAARHVIDLDSPLFLSDFSDTSSPAPRTLSLIHAQGKHSYMVVQNYLLDEGTFSASLAHQVLSGASNRTLLVNQVMSFVKRDGESGAVVDFEKIDYADQRRFEEFLSALAANLHAAGLKLIVAVPPEMSTDPTDVATRPFDYTWIGRTADEIYLMIYDLHAPTGPAGPLAPADWAKSVLKYAVTCVPRQKLLLGMAGYGFVWPAAGGLDGALNHREIDSLVRQYGGTRHYDTTLQSPYVTFTDPGGTSHVIWYENQESCAYKLQLVREYGLAGFGLWFLGSEGPGYWQAGKEVEIR
jgi:hypothetical protein